MQQPTLYLMLGYPGSGKTTASRTIHDLTGAAHIWADYERRIMFGMPTHSPEESRLLYDQLNQQTATLLADGTSVVFDTNFNFREDRELLRKVADAAGAITKLIWVKVPDAVARQRALSSEHAHDNKYPDRMSAEEFERIYNNLEVPTANERPIILDGTLITAAYVAEKLQLAAHPKD